MNVVAITGIVMNEPELHITASGISVSSLTVAVKRPHVKDKTDFIEVVLWRERAEFFANYFHKGYKIELSGHLETRLYESNGVMKKATELIADYISFGERKQVSPQSGEEPPQNADGQEENE